MDDCFFSLILFMQIIVLEYKKEWLSCDTVVNVNIMDIRPFDLLVCIRIICEQKDI